MSSTSPRTGRDTSGRRTPSTRDLLYDAAAALFAERGYENTTMADIAERAGTSRRTAFNHFPRKSDIPMLWTRRMADVALSEAQAPIPAETGQPVRDYLRLISRMVEADPAVSRQMMLGWTAAAGPILYESELLVDLAPLLAEGKPAGWVDPSVDLTVAAHTLSDVLMGACFRWTREGDAPVSLETQVDDGVTLVLRALHPAR
ncbi:TetR/AcrR family transcriptional regulator [Streptomyces sp. NPDC055078]